MTRPAAFPAYAARSEAISQNRSSGEARPAPRWDQRSPVATALRPVPRRLHWLAADWFCVRPGRLFPQRVALWTAEQETAEHETIDGGRHPRMSWKGLHDVRHSWLGWLRWRSQCTPGRHLENDRNDGAARARCRRHLDRSACRPGTSAPCDHRPRWRRAADAGRGRRGADDRLAHLHRRGLQLRRVARPAQPARSSVQEPERHRSRCCADTCNGATGSSNGSTACSPSRSGTFAAKSCS